MNLIPVGRWLDRQKGQTVKLKEVRKGETFSLYGQLLTYCGTQDTMAILKDVRSGKTITYGRQALDRVIKQTGWKIED